MLKYIAHRYQKSFNYKGRESKRMFWVTAACDSGLSILLCIPWALSALLPTSPVVQIVMVLFTTVLLWILVLSRFPGHLSALVRRLHDVNRSAWSLLVFLIPGVGPLVMLFWLVSAGTDGDNRYGPVPPRGFSEEETPGAVASVS